jgi:NDP-sugar pyrophosphorylase family protein
MPDAAPALPVAILAGGMATRLQPITHKIPKLMVEVAGEPFFSHQLRLLKGAGLTRIVLCVGHLGEMIATQYGTGTQWGVNIEYVFDGPVLLGTGGALVKALPLLGPSFYVLYGDSFLPIDYRAVERSFLASEKLGLMTVYSNRGRYDVSNVEFSDGEIKAYHKRNPTPAMRHIDYGLGLFKAAAFDGFSNHSPIDLATIQMALVARHQLAAYEMKERFYEIGSHTGLSELDALIRRGKFN